jgi:hypothetical protein
VAGRVPETTALIGHLVVTEHQGTDLATVTGVTERTMALPLPIPVRQTVAPHLCQDHVRQLEVSCPSARPA